MRKRKGSADPDPPTPKIQNTRPKPPMQVRKGKEQQIPTHTKLIPKHIKTPGNMQCKEEKGARRSDPTLNWIQNKIKTSREHVREEKERSADSDLTLT
jgi:hypothetical protein